MEKHILNKGGTLFTLDLSYEQSLLENKMRDVLYLRHLNKRLTNSVIAHAASKLLLDSLINEALFKRFNISITTNTARLVGTTIFSYDSYRRLKNNPEVNLTDFCDELLDDKLYQLKSLFEGKKIIITFQSLEGLFLLGVEDGKHRIND